MAAEVLPFQSAAGAVTLLPRKDGRRIFEVSTTGVDENLQGLGSDPFGGMSSMGLRVPTLPTADVSGRYLAMLCAFSMGERATGRILGYRQFVSIGVKQSGDPPFIVEMEVESPNWRFQDGNISWHLQQLGPPNNQGFPPNDRGPVDLRNFKFRFGMTPAFLYQTATVSGQFYVDLTAYTPPNAGKPWGRPLRNGAWPTVLDLRGNWRDDHAWVALDMPVEGPDTIVMFASVRQTDSDARPVAALPTPFYPEGMAKEDVFLLNFPGAIYWRVGASLIVEVY